MQINVISVKNGLYQKWEAIMVGFGRRAVKYLEYIKHPLPDLPFGFLQITCKSILQLELPISPF